MGGLVWCSGAVAGEAFLVFCQHCRSSLLGKENALVSHYSIPM